MLRDGADDQNFESNLDKEVARLARLPLLEYELCRNETAKRFDVRASVLDSEVKKVRRVEFGGTDDSKTGGTAVLFPETEPWPEPVDGSALLDALADTFTRHVVLPPGGADAAALWTLHAHAHDAASISPILAVTSPTAECGKTTLLTVLGAFVPKPLTLANITAAALFRAVEKWRPCLLIDEADTFLRDSDELRGILNSGHNRAAAFVIRTAGDDHEPRRFMTWAPKAIALIGKLQPTLASRAIHLELRRFAPGETVAPVRADRLDHLKPLARQAARWASDNDTALRDAEPSIPATLKGRRADNWRLMFAIADAAGGEWPARARGAAETLTAGRSDEIATVILLEDIRAIFALRGEDRITSSDLARALGEREDRPWSEWRRDKPISPRGIARLLEGFKIKPTKFRAAGYTPGTRGYNRADFDDVFTRYFPDTPDTSATAPQVKVSTPYSDSTSATPGQSVADRKPLKANLTAGCGAVALVSGETGQMDTDKAEKPDPDDYEERAAIMEFDGEMSREEAEKLARHGADYFSPE
jgi:putative DNA primase/helicase